ALSVFCFEPLRCPTRDGSMPQIGGHLMRLPGRVLEPVERLSEILFGLIMALTITGAVSVATADRFAIRTMLFAALGCNIAWGIIDAGMHLMARICGGGGHGVVFVA